MNQTIELKLLRPDVFATIPEYGTTGSAAVDLRAAIDDSVVLNPGDCQLLPTGVAIHISNPGLAGMIIPRSGLGHKKGLILGNSVGLIDSDYHGELMVSCWNRSENELTIDPLMRFAQLVIVLFLTIYCSCMRCHFHCNFYSTRPITGKQSFVH